MRPQRKRIEVLLRDILGANKGNRKEILTGSIVPE